MKIKCPFEPFEKAPDYTERELSIHFHEDHESTEALSDYTSGLIFQIHEKIEFYDNIIKDKSLIHVMVSSDAQNQAIRENLKSLLENE